MQARINGCQTHYVDKGKRTALPIVLVHGMTFDHQSWQPQIDLLEKQFRVVASDIKGHGKSEVGDGQYTHRQYADDVVALLDHLNIDRAVFCGLSMGGAICLRITELYPERVRALIICDSKAEADTNEAKYGREQAIQSVKKEGVKSFAEPFLKSVFAPGSFEKHPQIVESIRQTIIAMSPLALCGTLLAQAARTDTSAVLPKIRVPTLIMVGAEDKLTPPSLSREMQQKIPGAELKVIPDAAHVSNLENTGAFNNCLSEFLAKID